MNQSRKTLNIVPRLSYSPPPSPLRSFLTQHGFARRPSPSLHHIHSQTSITHLVPPCGARPVFACVVSLLGLTAHAQHNPLARSFSKHGLGQLIRCNDLLQLTAVFLFGALFVFLVGK